MFSKLSNIVEQWLKRFYNSYKYPYQKPIPHVLFRIPPSKNKSLTYLKEVREQKKSGTKAPHAQCVHVKFCKQQIYTKRNKAKQNK